jgi:imidazolonepropionase-like amidohydrolase
LTITVFKNAFIIDGTGREPLEGASIIVEGNIIKDIVCGSKNANFSNAEVIDCCGKTIMPGLIDAHVHVGLVDADIAMMRFNNYPSVMVIKAANILKDTLYQGFTTCRDAGGADAGFRIAVETGLIEGPRLQVAGPVLSQTGGHADMRAPCDFSEPFFDNPGFSAFICDGVPAVRKAARETLRRGSDFVKIMASGGCASPSDDIGDSSQYSLEEIKAAVFEAESAGTYVSAHCYTNRGAMLCIEGGVRTIEHGNCISRQVIRKMKEAGTILIPTLSTYELAVTKGEDFGLPSYFRKKMKIVQETALETVAIAHEEGVVIGSGSDVVGPFQKWKGLELELKSRVMGTMGAIVSATKTNAEIMGIDKYVGTLEPQKYADLLVVDGNPLKNIKIIQDYNEKILVIMKDGQFYKKKL